MSYDVNRIRYFDPVVENYGGQGSLEDTINDKYEDFNIAVDLTVEITDRYSCGFANENNQREERTYSSTNGSISFLKGTNGHLTTNYTDISMLNPSKNTSECLGIESINITYDSWMHPQITIKFVDIKGATVFQPAEYGYYNENESMSTSFLYKALFSFPYPLFKLTVKGFYGKGVTYHLSVFNTKMELDANNGNFVITVNFIGFMYGIFSDIPMTYIGIAPYTEKGSLYWEESINSNEKFWFENIDGSRTKMVKFPELMLLLAKAANHLEKIEENQGESVVNSEDEINELKTILEIFNKIDFLEEYDENLQGPGNQSPSYVWIYQQEGTDFNILLNLIRQYESAHGKQINAYKKDGVEAPYFWHNDSGIKSIVSSDYNKWAEGRDYGKQYFYFTYNKNALSTTKENIISLIGKLQEEHNKKIEEYNCNKIETIRKCIGFDPTIKNMYNLAFAHMDTFMEFFYDYMRKIKNQLESNDEKRKKSHYIEGDEIETDTNRSDLSSSVDSSFRNGEYLPPFTAFYSKGNLKIGGKVMDWIENIFPSKANDLEEVRLVKELFNGAKIYFDAANDAAKVLADATAGNEGGQGIKEIIPQTTFDIANNGFVKNPYKILKTEFDSSSSYENLYAELIYIFITRLYNFNRWENIYKGLPTANTNEPIGYTAAFRFGETEAINFYLAIKDDYRMKTFISQLVNDFNGDEVLKLSIGGAYDVDNTDSLTRNNNIKHKSVLTVLQDIGNGNLLIENGGLCRYNTLKIEDKEYLPIGDISINNSRRAYQEMDISDSEFGETKFLDVSNFSTKNTFKIINDGDYFKNISESVSTFLSETSEMHSFMTDENVGFDFSYEIDDSKIENPENIYLDYCSDGFITRPSVCGGGGTWKQRPSIFDDDGFGELYDLQDDIKVKAMMFLESVPMEYDIRNEKHLSMLGLHYENTNASVLNVSLLREGAFYWFESNPNSFKDGNKYKTIVSNENGETKIKWFKSNNRDSHNAIIQHINITSPLTNESTEDYGIVGFPKFSDSRTETVKKYFEDWATNDYQEIESILRTKLKSTIVYSTETEYSDFDPEPYVTTTEEIQRGILKQEDTSTAGQKIQKFLQDLMLKQVCIIDYYSNTDFSNNLKPIKAENIKNAFNWFLYGIKKIYADLISGNLSEDAVSELGRNILENPFRNTDFYHSEYMSLKSLYDKWLCSPYGNRKWKFGSSDNEFDNFYYVDTFYNNIGNILDVNIVKLAEWLSDEIPTSSTGEEEALMGWHGKTLYDYMVDIAVDCGGMLLALPQKIGNANPSEMFKPYNVYDDWKTDSSCFMFVYSYRPSERLGDYDLADIDMNGYSPEGDGFNLTDAEIVGKLFGGDDGETVPAFGVTFAKQNQSYFKNISLNSETNGASEAAIAATLNIASKSDESNGSSLSLYGQDLYKIFSNYSYECTVETMGNMMIMPPMYFQLNNVPLWKGAYMIKKVEHNIVAGDMTTKFTGLRQNKYAVPFVKADVSTLRIISSSEGGGEGMFGGQEEYNGGYTANTEGNRKYTMSTKIDMSDVDTDNITDTKPIICLTPAHGPETGKKLEWEWSARLIDDYIIPKLKKYKYKDGTPFNVHRCNKKDENGNVSFTSRRGYNMTEVTQLVRKYGSKGVISIVPHWNGIPETATTKTNGTYLFPLMNIDVERNTVGRGIRQDSIRLIDCMCGEVTKLYENRDLYTKMPKKGDSYFVNGQINRTFRIPGRDGALEPNCACVLSENLFANFESNPSIHWTSQNYDAVGPDGRYQTGRAWLESKEGMEAISDIHVNGIVKYINNLEPPQYIVNPFGNENNNSGTTQIGTTASGTSIFYNFLS